MRAHDHHGSHWHCDKKVDALTKHKQQAEQLLIVLDVGGVILTDAMRLMLREIANATGRSEDDVQNVYRSTGLRDQLWMGKITTAEFWGSLGAALGSRLGSASILDQRMIALCRPLVAPQSLAAHPAPIALLSNHRHEWLLPSLEAHGFGSIEAEVFCSSQMGVVKPQVAAYRLVQRAASGRQVLFVDDQEHNLAPARTLGWRTLRADGPEWIDAAWITANSLLQKPA